MDQKTELFQLNLCFDVNKFSVNMHKGIFRILISWFVRSRGFTVLDRPPPAHHWVSLSTFMLMIHRFTCLLEATSAGILEAANKINWEQHQGCRTKPSSCRHLIRNSKMVQSDLWVRPSRRSVTFSLTCSRVRDRCVKSDSELVEWFLDETCEGKHFWERPEPW